MGIVKKIGIGFGLLVVGLIVLGVIVSPKKKDDGFRYIDHAHDAPAEQPAAPEPVAQPLTKEQSDAADKLATEMQTERVFGNYDLSGTTVFVVVMPKWYLLSFADKQTATAVALNWGRITNPKADTVIFNDSRTNNRVATFTKLLGLKID